MRTQGQTDMGKVIVTVRNFGKEPKNPGNDNTSNDDIIYGR